MSEKLHEYRKSYEKGELLESTISENPFIQFKNWFKELEESKTVEEVNAMTISTIGLDGFPRGRVVLLKEFHEEGFIFYTNYESEKGQAIAQNNRIAISFYWPELQRQVLIKGTVSKTSEENSKNYFAVRPRKSQLGAAVSHQSQVLENRKVLEETMELLEKKYEDSEIPKPENWGGYSIKPVEFEFWQGRRSRLHDRIRYTKINEVWKIDRLAP